MNNISQKFSQPSYLSFVCDVYSIALKEWSQLDSHFKTPTSWVSLVNDNARVTREDVAYVLLLAVMWTLLRSLISKFLFKPIVIMSGLKDEEAKKAPESAWKFIFYLSTWSYSCYILFFTKNNFFFDVPSTFKGWSLDSPVPSELYIAYLIQLSFYCHSVYATLFMDVWRKDSHVMMLHHVVTLLLIGFSYAFRYTNVGVLILFLHDITDIVLEGTKLLLYYKTKGGMWYRIGDVGSTVGFILFGLAWFVFRLYWYPLKAMYAAGYLSKVVTSDVIFYTFFNLLLWILLAMNIYWFTLIVLMAYRILTKQTSEINDTREYDTDGYSEQKKRN